MSLSDHPNLTCFDIPDGFVFGAATAAYQTEATSSGGGDPENWDTLAATPGNVVPTGLARIICSRTSPPPVRPNPGSHIRWGQCQRFLQPVALEQLRMGRGV